MPSSRELEAALRRVRFEIDRRRGKGSHKMAFFRREGKILVAFPFPDVAELTPGTLGSIRRNLKLTRQQFSRFLSHDLSADEYEQILSDKP